MDIREKLAKVARENISLFMDAGGGMYNLDIDISGIYDKRESGEPYHPMGIFQIYPYEEGDNYGSIYVLAYYPYNDRGDCENDCYAPDDETLKEIYERVKAELNGKYPMTTDTKSLKPFVKAKTIEEKVAIINAWEENRGAESEEYIYDFNEEADEEAFANMYGEHALEVRRYKARFWMAGNAFYCDVADKSMRVSQKVFALTEKNIDSHFDNILDEVLDMYYDFLSYHKEGEKEDALNAITSSYNNLIDFKALYFSKNKPKAFRWIAVSNDHSYEEESDREFDTEKECYNDMRNHALEKMKWNTEYYDLDDCVDENDYIHYGVRFHKDKIMHFSYSGGYLYKIVPSKKFTYEDYEELVKEVNEIIENEGIIL